MKPPDILTCVLCNQLESAADSMANGCSSCNCGLCNANFVAFAECACRDTDLVGADPLGQLFVHVVGKGIIVWELVWDIDHAKGHDAVPLSTLPLHSEAQTAEMARAGTAMPFFPGHIITNSSVHGAETDGEELLDELCRNCGLD